MSRSLWPTVSRRSTRMTSCLEEGTRKSSRSCQTDAGGAATPTRSGEVFASGRRLVKRETRLPLLRDQPKRDDRPEPACGGVLLGQHLIQPGGDDLSDVVAVLFQHHQMAIAADANIVELDEVHVHAGLFEVTDGAVVVRRIERRFRGNVENGTVPNGDQLFRGFLLTPAARQIRTVGLLLPHELER